MDELLILLIPLGGTLFGVIIGAILTHIFTIWKKFLELDA